jgi:predicted secreted protein
MQISITIREYNMESSLKTQTRTTVSSSNPTTGYIWKEMQFYQRDTCMPILLK